MDSAKLISKNNLTTIHNKRSRGNSQITYYWTLERFIETTQMEFEYDEFPSSSEFDKPTSELKATLLTMLNSGTAFDFHYEPKEKDFLSIRKDNNNNVFINFILENGLWVEEEFTGTLRNQVEDNYETIKTGEIRLNN